MSDTNRRIDNGKSVPDKSVGTLAARNATIGNLVVTGTFVEPNVSTQFSNMTVTGTLGAGTVNATTSSIGNLTVTGTLVNANATTSQFAAVSVTGNASVGGNVVVGRDGIFCGATSGVTTLATTQYTSNVGLLYTTGTGLNTPANIISTGIITMTNNTQNQFGFVDYTTPTLAPGTPFRIAFDYLYAGAADGFCAQLWFSNNDPTTAIGSNADRSVTNAAIGYRFGYDIFSNKTAGFYQNANVSSGASVSLAKSASALPGNSWCTYTWTFDGASVWTTQVSNAANTAQMYMANVVVDPLALGIWTGATYPNTLRMYGASGGQTALQQIRNVTVSTTTLGNVRGIGCGFVGAANVSTGAYVASSAGTGSAPIVGNTYVSFVGNGTANGGYLDAGPQTFTRFATGATVMAYVAFTAPNVETQRYEAICSFGNGTGANTFRLNRNGNSSTTIMYVTDSVGNTCVAGAGGNIVPYVPSVWTGVFTPPTTCTMYQNATLVNTNTNSGTIMSLAPSVVMPHTYVGKSQFGGDPYASMNLYGFVYWNASLTPAQITQAYTYLTAGTGSLPRPEAISAPLTILPTAPNALVGKSAYVQNVTAQNGNVTATNANASSVGVTNSVTIAGNLSVVTDVNARGNVAVSKNAVVTGNVSATNVNATGNLAVTNFATVTGGINLPGNAAAAFGTPGNAAVVLTLGSFANVLSYANTYDTPANIAATGNIVMTANVGGQVQSVSYIVPGLVPGVPFFANVAFTYLTPVRTSEDFFGIQLFSSENGTTPFGTNTSGLTGLTGVGGYMFGYIVGTKVIRTNQTSGIGNQSGIFGPNIVQNSTYNYYIGFDGVQTWTYNISNTTTTITSGTYVDTFSLYNMSRATYPNVVRLRACSNSGMLIMANSVNIVANVGTPYSSSQGVVVKTLGSYANVLSYANTYDTLANIAATGNLILSDNTANQVQSVTYVVPGLAPGVAFSANVGFTSSSYQSTSNNSGDAYAIQFFPSDIGTLPLCTGTVNFDGNVNGLGYTFGYIYGNVAASIASKYGWYYYSSTGARTVYNQTFNPVLAINSTYNFFVGFDGVQTWTYKVSNSTTVIASGTATDPAALYNMSMALYPTTVRIRANSNNGISLITANAVSIVANVGVGYASATANASGFIVADSNNATMMTIKSASPYVATLGSVIANVAATVGPGSLNVFGPTYFGNSTTITGPTTVSGPSTFSGATTFNAPVTLNANIVPNATSGIVWNGGTPTTMIETYYGVGDRYGLGVAVGNATRMYTALSYGAASVALGKYSTVGGIQTTDWIYANAWPTYAGVYMTSNVSVASNVSSSTGNVILAAQTIRVTGGDLGNNSVLALNASGGTQNNMINLWGANPSGTATNVWGFGLASGTLRYNAILTSHIHGFYSNTFTCATIQTSGTAIAGNANSEALTVTNSYGTGFTGNAVTLATTTAAGTGFNMLMATANGVKQFRVAGNGATYANGPYSSAGADYAEYFEWADGNPGAEDRRGLTVVLDGGDKIRIATGTDASNDIIGVVSAVPTTIGDSAWSRWQGMYVTDAFGCATTELNPAYDPDAEYVPRSERKEWAPIGLVGKLRVLTGRPVGSSWIRMKTVITPGVDLWLVRRPRL